MTAPAGFRTQTDLKSWGRLAAPEQTAARPRHRDELAGLLKAAQDAGTPVLARGLGRSYGDVAQNGGGAVIVTTRLDRFIAFDAEAGQLTAEAGASLAEVMKLTVPYGWVPPVLPGTRYVTLGGALANDVHGKNHHRAGTFGGHVRRFGLMRSDRGLVEVTPETEPELFAATIGGLGLTGLVTDVTIDLQPIKGAYMDQETVPMGGLHDFFALAAEKTAVHEHTVAWVDCTATGDAVGRGLFTSADWPTSRGLLNPPGDHPVAALPIDAPGLALNSMTLKAFNALNRRLHAKSQRKRVHFGASLFPLDAIGDWNRLYGARGFYQHQSVVPMADAPDAIGEMLAAIAKSKQGSMLAVLKTFGDLASPGGMSFPMPGATLALDFANKGAATLKLLEHLDAIAAEAGGRVYPAKDARMSGALFRQGYPGWARVLAAADPAFASDFQRRVNA